MEQGEFRDSNHFSFEISYTSTQVLLPCIQFVPISLQLEDYHQLNFQNQPAKNFWNIYLGTLGVFLFD